VESIAAAWQNHERDHTATQIQRQYVEVRGTLEPEAAARKHASEHPRQLTVLAVPAWQTRHGRERRRTTAAAACRTR
jgi:hypothetical protein